MVRDYTRDITEQEREELQQVLAGLPLVARRWSASCGCIVVETVVMLSGLLVIGGIVSLFSNVRFSEIVGALLMLGSMVACVVAGMVIWDHFSENRSWRTSGRALRQDLQLVMELGTAQVRRVTATDVIEVDVFDEDDGKAFIFDVGNGRSLVLWGQNCWPKNPDEAWPNSEFEIVRFGESTALMELRCFGRKLEPSLVTEGECVDWLVEDEREKLLDLPPHEVLKRFMEE